MGFFLKEVKLLLHLKKKELKCLCDFLLCFMFPQSFHVQNKLSSQINAIQVLFKNFMLKKQDIIEVKIEA